MSKLPQYSGDGHYGPNCVKCGFDEASTKYVPPAFGIDRDMYECHGAPAQDEYLERECVRCGFQWAEDVIGG